MTEQEVIESGLLYLTCPICGHVVSSGECKRTSSHMFNIEIHCFSCNKNFYGLKTCNSIKLWEHEDFALFEEKERFCITYYKRGKPVEEW